MAKKKKTEKTKTKRKRNLYTLRVSLVSGPPTDGFEGERIYRDIEILGNQTLDRLHMIIFDAFDREEEHLHEFIIEKNPKKRLNPSYPPYDDKKVFKFTDYVDDWDKLSKLSRRCKMDQLELKQEHMFFYMFDFGDSWLHGIEVVSVEKTEKSRGFPKIVNRVGQSPPQYQDEDEFEDDDFDDDFDDYCEDCPDKPECDEYKDRMVTKQNNRKGNLAVVDDKYLEEVLDEDDEDIAFAEQLLEADPEFADFAEKLACAVEIEDIEEFKEKMSEWSDNYDVVSAMEELMDQKWPGGFIDNEDFEEEVGTDDDSLRHDFDEHTDDVLKNASDEEIEFAMEFLKRNPKVGRMIQKIASDPTVGSEEEVDRKLQEISESESMLSTIAEMMSERMPPEPESVEEAMLQAKKYSKALTEDINEAVGKSAEEEPVE